MPSDYAITARRDVPSMATARSDRAPLCDVPLDIAPDGRCDAFNPVELLLASVAACMLKAIERATPMLRFSLRAVEVHVYAVRQDRPPRLASVDYALIVDTDESDARLELLHRNVQKYGTIYNTLNSAVKLTGTIARHPVVELALATTSDNTTADDIC